jgi:hypothetical protein
LIDIVSKILSNILIIAIMAEYSSENNTNHIENFGLFECLTNGTHPFVAIILFCTLI